MLFFSYWYPNAVLSNQAYFAKQHAQALSKVCELEVLAVHILPGKTLYDFNYQCEIDEHGIRTHRVYILSKFYKIFYVALPWQYLMLKKIIKLHIRNRFEFGSIHSNVLYPCGIVGAKLSKHFQCKHVITEHWSKLDKFFKVSLYKKLGRKAYDTADALTAVSQQLADTMQKYHHNKMMRLVPNVIDASKFYVDAQIEKHGCLTFTAVAHWHAPKNPFYYLEALKQLFDEKTIPSFKVILIGEGDILKTVKDKQYPYPIEMPGNLSPDALCRHLNQCHVFLHGSDFETFSVVMVEALMCGLPCVVSDVGIAKQIINEQNGFIAESSSQDWKQKIEKVVNTKFDAKIIASQIDGIYSLEAVAKKFELLYDEAGISS